MAQSSTALPPGHVTEPFATTRELVNSKHQGEQRSAQPADWLCLLQSEFPLHCVGMRFCPVTLKLPAIRLAGLCRLIAARRAVLRRQEGLAAPQGIPKSAVG